MVTWIWADNIPNRHIHFIGINMKMLVLNMKIIKLIQNHTTDNEFDFLEGKGLTDSRKLFIFTFAS